MSNLEYFYTINAVLAINVCVMFFEYLFVIISQGGKSVKAGSKPKEDQLPGRPLPNPTEADKAIEARWIRIVNNHNETVPFGFLMFLVANKMTATRIESEPRLALLIVIILYTAFRFLFLVCYMLAVQPWRTICWASSIMCILAGGLIGVVCAFESLNWGPYS